MMPEAPIAQMPTRTLHSHEVVSSKKVQEIAKNAAEKPRGSDAKLLVSLAITAVEHMHTVVFGEQAQVFPEAMQLAKAWLKPNDESGEEKVFDINKLGEYQKIITQEAYASSFPIGEKEVEIFRKEIKKEHEQWDENPRRPGTHDPRVQARYVTGSLLLYILYLDPQYQGIHPDKPSWHARAGANTLASIITSDAAKVMSRKDNTTNHQENIDTLVEKELTNW